MPQFVKLVYSEQKGHVEFFFTPITTLQGLRFHVAVSGVQGQTHHFTMQELGISEATFYN